MKPTASLKRNVNISSVSRLVSKALCDYVYQQPKSRSYTFLWAPKRKPSTRELPLGSFVPSGALESLKTLGLEELRVTLYPDPEDSEDYDNNFYYGTLSITATLPEDRDRGQTYLTGNLAHELTHAQQMRTQGDSYEGIGPTDPVEYALNKDEMEAHIREFVRRSKGLHEPLEDVVREHWENFFSEDNESAKRVVDEYLRKMKR